MSTKSKIKPKSKVKSTSAVPVVESNASRSGNRMGRPRVKPAEPATRHIRKKPAMDSGFLCGGDHSPIWGRSGDVKFESVSPQHADKGTCGRCRRVAKSPTWELIA